MTETTAAKGPGRYDAEAAAARKACRARGVVLIVRGGDRGEGFEVQLPGDDVLELPRILREMANEIEAALAQSLPQG